MEENIKNELLQVIKDLEEQRRQVINLQKLELDKDRIDYYIGVQETTERHIKALRGLI